MNNKIIVLGAAITALAVTGCKSDVEKVCAKMAEVAASDPQVKELGKKMRSEFEDTAACATKMKEQKAEDPAAFAKLAPCVDKATKLDGIMECFFSAAEK